MGWLPAGRGAACAAADRKVGGAASQFVPKKRGLSKTGKETALKGRYHSIMSERFSGCPPWAERGEAPNQHTTNQPIGSNDHRNRRTSSRRHDAWRGLELLRPLDLLVDDLPRFFKRLRGCRQRRRAGEPQPVFVVDRDDESRLPRQVEAVEVVGFGLKKESSRPRGRA